jgi:hypothetical protein
MEVNPMRGVGWTGAVANLQAAIRHASVTGQEARFATYLAGVLPKSGSSRSSQQVIPAVEHGVKAKPGYLERARS